MAQAPETRRRLSVERTKRWARANPAKRAQNDFVQGLKKRFGLTPAAYQAMLDGQGGCCAICS